MTRILSALLCLGLLLGVPAAAHAQTRLTLPMIAYQAPDRQFTLSVGAWFGDGRWRFVGPVDVAADSTLIMVDLRFRLRGPWSIGFDYAGGDWRNITFNGAPAPSTVSGRVSMANVDLRYRLGSGMIPFDVFLGWQYYRARTDDTGLNTSDEARAGGFRLGIEGVVPLGGGPWSLRGFAAYAPSLGVTENFTSGGTTTTTLYNGSFADVQVAVRYDTGARWAGEVGWRGQRIDFRRPTDVLEHTLSGAFVHLIWRGP